MTRSDVLDRLCKLTSTVNEKRFGFSVASDCFCTGRNMPDGYHFDEAVLAYIEEAVAEKIARGRDQERLAAVVEAAEVVLKELPPPPAPPPGKTLPSAGLALTTLRACLDLARAESGQ